MAGLDVIHLVFGQPLLPVQVGWHVNELAVGGVDRTAADIGAGELAFLRFHPEVAVKIIGQRIGAQHRLSGFDAKFHGHVADRNAVHIQYFDRQRLCQPLRDLAALLMADIGLHGIRGQRRNLQTKIGHGI